MKRLQNRIAESGLTLPVMAVYAVGIWLLAGLLPQQWWPQIASFALTSYMMVELSNSNALLRVRSRMVTSTFIALSCMMCFMFGSLTGSLVQLFSVAALLLLLTTYQDQQSPGRTFYAFLLLSLASLPYVRILIFIPVIWLLMATQLQSFSWRNLFASLIGLLTPYWFIFLWFIYQRDFTPLILHFTALADFSFVFDYSTVRAGQWMTFFLVLVLSVIGIINFWRNSFEDKIRIRLIYGLFTWMVLFCLVLTALQPHHFDPLMRLAVIFASPLIAHFLTLTSSRLTNIIFFIAIALVLLATAINLWMSSSLF